MKRERWGSLLVQEKYREEKACDNDDNIDNNSNNNNNNNVTLRQFTANRPDIMLDYGKNGKPAY